MNNNVIDPDEHVESVFDDASFRSKSCQFFVLQFR